MRSKNSGDVDSGLASVVTSVSAAARSCPGRRRAPPPSPSPPSSDGVPPPTKTVSTGHLAHSAGRHRELGAHRGQPPLRRRSAQFPGGVGVEVAVAAPRRAERHVDIDAERRSRRQAHIRMRIRRRAASHPASIPDRLLLTVSTNLARLERVGAVRGRMARMTAPHDPAQCCAGGSAACRFQARLYAVVVWPDAVDPPTCTSAGRRICAAGTAHRWFCAVRTPAP